MSEIRATTISDAAGTGPIDLHKQSAAKAWVRGNSLAVVSESLNISGGIDGAIGVNTWNLTSDMSSSNYSVVASSVIGSYLPYLTQTHTMTASNVLLYSTRAYDATAHDHDQCFAAQGDLA